MTKRYESRRRDDNEWWVVSTCPEPDRAKGSRAVVCGCSETYGDSETTANHIAAALNAYEGEDFQKDGTVAGSHDDSCGHDKGKQAREPWYRLRRRVQALEEGSPSIPLLWEAIRKLRKKKESTPSVSYIQKDYDWLVPRLEGLEAIIDEDGPGVGDYVVTTDKNRYRVTATGERCVAEVPYNREDNPRVPARALADRICRWLNKESR